MMFVLILLLGLNISVRAADIPMLMNYQGNVTDASGVPVNGDGFFKFAIVNEAGDTAHWASDGTTLDGTEPTAAVTIPVSNGSFTVKLGDTNLANMVALSPSIFENTSIFLRVWFSVEGTVFEQFTTDMQILGTGFAFKAQVANTLDGKTTADFATSGHGHTDFEKRMDELELLIKSLDITTICENHPEDRACGFIF